MAERLFGLEAELAVSGRRGTALLQAPVLVAHLADIARRTLTALPGGTNRLYLTNGSCFYVDAGAHPELATAECTTPTEAVSQLHAGQRLIERLARAAGEALKADDVLVSRANVDYVGGTSWGCHESYLGTRPLEAYADWLVPHLVSRIVYTGAGGLDPRAPGIRFSLSPRVAFITHAVSSNSVEHRGIFHLRDEPLSRVHTRIHVLAGDHACSQYATWLKVATTALVVALADANRRRHDWVKLVNPVADLALFARDRTHRARVIVRGGREESKTATEIQRHLLGRVEDNLDADTMPAWAGEACRRWREALDRVDRIDAAPSHAFDWALKFALFRREIAQSGFTPEGVEAWSLALERLLPPRGPGLSGVMSPHLASAATIEAARARGAIRPEDLAEATASLAKHGLAWDGLDAFTALRRQLCALDVHFGAMTSGLFDSLDRGGHLPEHRMVSERQIEEAAVDPPPRTRATPRGLWVRRLASRAEPYMCDWSGITGSNVRLALDDPFETKGQWVGLRQGADVAAELFGAVPF